ncbi:MAG: hypothetical protein WCA95_05120 [Opitutaceae bacterium]
MRTGTKAAELRARLVRAHGLLRRAQGTGDASAIAVADRRVEDLVKSLNAAYETQRLIKLAKARAKEARAAIGRALEIGNYERARVQRGHFDAEMATVARLELEAKR